MTDYIDSWDSWSGEVVRVIKRLRADVDLIRKEIGVWPESFHRGRAFEKELQSRLDRKSRATIDKLRADVDALLAVCENEAAADVASDEDKKGSCSVCGDHEQLMMCHDCVSSAGVSREQCGYDRAKADIVSWLRKQAEDNPIVGVAAVFANRVESGAADKESMQSDCLLHPNASLSCSECERADAVRLLRELEKA